jgi:hypothetical protein
MEKQTGVPGTSKIALGVIGVVAVLALFALVAVMYGVDVSSIVRS